MRVLLASLAALAGAATTACTDQDLAKFQQDASEAAHQALTTARDSLGGPDAAQRAALEDRIKTFLANDAKSMSYFTPENKLVVLSREEMQAPNATPVSIIMKRELQYELNTGWNKTREKTYTGMPNSGDILNPAAYDNERLLTAADELWIKNGFNYVPPEDPNIQQSIEVVLDGNKATLERYDMVPEGMTIQAAADQKVGTANQVAAVAGARARAAEAAAKAVCDSATQAIKGEVGDTWYDSAMAGGKPYEWSITYTNNDVQGRDVKSFAIRENAGAPIFIVDTTRLGVLTPTTVHVFDKNASLCTPNTGSDEEFRNTLAILRQARQSDAVELQLRGLGGYHTAGIDDVLGIR